MTKRSFVRRIAVLFTVLCVLLAAVLAAYSASSYSILYNEIRQNAENFLMLCGGELKSRLAMMDAALESLLLQKSTDLQLLKSGSESSRFYASQAIHNYLSDILQGGVCLDCMVVADEKYGLCIDANGASDISFWERDAFRRFTADSTGDSSQVAGWRAVELNGRDYVYKMYVYKGRAVAAFVRAARFLRTLPDADYGEQTLALTDADGRIIDFVGGLAGGPADGGPADGGPADGEPADDSPNINSLTNGNRVIASYPLEKGNIRLFSVISGGSVFKQLRSGTVLVLAAIICTLVSGILLIRYLRRELVKPLVSVTGAMQRIDGGEYSLRIEGEYGTAELTTLKDTFNRLMDEVVELKFRAYERALELKDMELKSVRLQMRPHFFLNAMTTISSLASQGRDGEIKAYIDTLSRYIRYAFKSGMHTVAIREEIRHVETYFEMQELRYPGCTFYYVELPEELADWAIPQMTVQTIIENEFKYAIQQGALLTVLIKISECKRGGEPMLMIEIEDDGGGYPEDVLEYMNGRKERGESDGTRVGLWSVKRMLELMYGRNDLIELSNKEPHGCLNRIFVPKQPSAEDGVMARQ